MSDCFEFLSIISHGTPIQTAINTEGTFTNKIVEYFSQTLCRGKAWTQYFLDATNLVKQDDFDDPEKVEIFDNILTIKETEFNLHQSDVFTISTDFNERIGLLRLFEALSQNKLQSISDSKKVLEFFGVENVEFYNGYNYFIAYPDDAQNYFVNPLFSEFSDIKDLTNAWIVNLPSYLLDSQYDQLRQNLEAYFNKIKKPSQRAFFPYTLII